MPTYEPMSLDELTADAPASDGGGAGSYRAPAASVAMAPMSLDELTADAPASNGEEFMSAPPPGMVMDPQSGQMIDTNARAELLRREGGVMQSASDMAGQFAAGTPIVGEYLDEAAGLFGGDMARENARAKLGAYEEANPGTAMALRTAGGISGTVGMVAAAPATAGRMFGMGGTTTAGRLAASGASGLGIGAVQGFGAGEGGIEDRSWEALKGGGVGLGLGLASVPAGALIGRGVNAVADRFAASGGPFSRATQDLVGRTLGDEGLSIEDASRMAREMGPSAMLADATPGLRYRAEQIAQSDNPARSGVISSLAERSAGAKDRIGAAYNGALGERPNVQQTLAGMTATAKENADRLYGQARLENAPVDVSPVLKVIDGQLLTPAERIAGKSSLPDDDVDSALKWIRSNLADDTSQSTGIDRLDRLERRVRARTKSAFDTGRSDVGHALNEVGKTLREQMKASSPVYREARATFSDDMAVKDAFDTGQKLFGSKTHPDFLAADIADMSTAERDALKLGVRAAVDESMGRVRNGSLKGRQLLDSDFNERKILTVLGEDDGRALINSLQGEQAMAETANQAIGGSATARRLDNPFRPTPLSAQDNRARGIILSAANLKFGDATARAMEYGRDFLGRRSADTMASELGPALTATGDARERVAQALRDSAARRGTSRAMDPRRRELVDLILKGGFLASGPSALR